LNTDKTPFPNDPKAFAERHLPSNSFTEDSIYTRISVSYPGLSVVSLKPSRFAGKKFELRFSPKTLFVILAFAAILPAANAACQDTLPPAPSIVNVTTSGLEGSLSVDFDDENAYRLAMVIDGKDIDAWHYDSSHWTSPDLLDDGKNLKTQFFNERYDKIRVDMYLEGISGCPDTPTSSMEWSHNLGLSLQEIFNSNQYTAAVDAREDEWISMLGRDPDKVEQHIYKRGFNIQQQTVLMADAVVGGDPYDYCYSSPSATCADAEGKIHARLGSLFVLSNPENSVAGVESILGIGFNTKTSVLRWGQSSAAGGHCKKGHAAKPYPGYIGNAPDNGQPCSLDYFHRYAASAATVKVYVGNNDAGCRNYTLTTNPATVSTVTTASPAVLTGLDPTGPGLLVSLTASSTAGAGPTALSTTPIRPCRCACEALVAPAIHSISTSVSDGTLHVDFSPPANLPDECARPGMITYNVTTDPPAPAFVPRFDTGSCNVCGEERVIVPIGIDECPSMCDGTAEGASYENGTRFVDEIFKYRTGCDDCALTCGDICEGDGAACGSSDFLDVCEGGKDFYRIVCLSKTWEPPLASISGLDPTIDYTVTITARNELGLSLPTTTVSARPCFCSCEIPSAPTGVSVASHLKGTLTVKFDGPSNIPSRCHDANGIRYTTPETTGAKRVHSDGHQGLLYVITAEPAEFGAAIITATFPKPTGTLVGLDSSIKYSVRVRAKNALGQGAASTVATNAVPMPTGGAGARQSWSAIREFGNGLSELARGVSATFTLLSPQQDPSGGYDGRIFLRGESQIVIYGDGAILDAKSTGTFFEIRARASLALHNMTMLNGLSGPPAYGCKGGAIMANNAYKLEVYDSTFEANVGAKRGGALMINLVPYGAIFVRVNFTGNMIPMDQEGSGGALALHYQPDSIVRDCLFWKNYAVSHLFFM
jgi:hypothetical protein